MGLNDPSYHCSKPRPSIESVRAAQLLFLRQALVTAPLYWFYANGERIRKASKFASVIAAEREAEYQRELENEASAREKTSSSTMTETA